MQQVCRSPQGDLRRFIDSAVSVQRDVLPVPTKAKQMPVMLPGQYIEQLVCSWEYGERSGGAIPNMKRGIVLIQAAVEN